MPHIQSPLNKFRKDRFIMVVPVPATLREIAAKYDRTNATVLPDSFTFSVWGAVVPEVSVPSVTQRYGGQSMKISTHVREVYPNLTVNFTIDNRFNNYWFIYKWLDILNDDHSSSYDASNIGGENKYTSDKIIKKYAADISIFALDEYDKRTVEFKYTYAFPVKLGGITLSNRDATEAETSVEFSFGQFFCKLVEEVNSL